MKQDSAIKYSRVFCFLWVVGGVLSTVQARADSSAAVAAAAAANPNYCTNTCNYLIEPKTHQILNLKGIVGWTAEDDSQCASMAMPTSSTAPTTLAQFQCMYHTGQLMQQCMAYDSAEQAGTMEEVMEGLDYAAAGVCAMACFDPDVFSKVNMIQACDYTAMGVNALEIVDVFTEKSSIVSMAVESLMGVAGGAGSAASVVIDNGGTNASAKQSIQQTHYLACGTAALMTLEGTLRAFNFGEDNKTKDQACSVIVSLDSASPTIGTGSTPTGEVQVGTVLTAGSVTNGGSNLASGVGSTAGAGSSASGTSGSSTSGASSTSGSTTASSTTVTNVPTAMTSCAQNGMGTQTGGCGLTADQLAAPDATMLTGNLGPAAADYASRNPNLPSQLARGGSGVSDSSGGDLQPLAKLASAAIASASQFGAVGGSVNSSSAPFVASKSSPSLSEGSSFTSASRAPASVNSSLALPAPQVEFVNIPSSASAPAVTTATTPSVTAAANPNDIWHAGYSGSIFDIVSSKMTNTTSRVTYSEWLTPMNRGLAGLAPLSTVQAGTKP